MADQLWWHPHASLHGLLQNYGPSTQSAISKGLEGQFDWLLHNVSFFKGPNEASRKSVEEAKSVTLRGKKFTIDARLKQATLDASVLLDLDELQTHILLKRYIKDMGLDQASENMNPNEPLAISHEELLQVLAYYHRERLLLLKCIQFILLQGMTEPLFEQYGAKLVKGGLEDQLFAALRSNTESSRPASIMGSHVAAGTLAGRLNALVKHFGAAGNAGWLLGVHSTLREQVLAERCELLSCLMLVYEVGGAKCAGHRVLELIRMLGAANSSKPASEQQAGAGSMALSVAVAPSPMLAFAGSSGGNANLAAVVEFLSCALIMAVVDLPEFVTLVQAGPGGGAAPESALPLGGKLRDVHAEIKDWPGTAGSVMLLLTWCGVLRLLDGHIDLGETAAEELQQRAAAVGGFEAAAGMLELAGSMLSTAIAQLCRGIMLKGLCVLATAFELGPTRQDAQSFGTVLKLLKAIITDDPHVCAAVWDDSQDLFEPLRAVLRDAAAVFPAVPGPYLQMLVALSAGSQAAAAAYAHLQGSPRLMCLHHASDPVVRRTGSTSVTLAEGSVWNQAPSVATMALPGGIQGSVLPLPAVLSHLEPNSWAMVYWDVGGTHRSFGQLLLLGRAVHCLHVMRTASSGASLDPAALDDLCDVLALFASLASEQPGLVVPDLMSITVEAAGSASSDAPAPKQTWLDVAAGAISILSGLAASGVTTSPAAGSVGASAADLKARMLTGVENGLKLLQAISQHHPLQVLDRLQAMPAFATSMASLRVPGSLPMSQLPLVDPDPGVVLQGLVPQAGEYRAVLEAPGGTYPMTRAFLDLLASLLARGFTQAPISQYVLYCLYDLLPKHSQWQYASAKERWSVTGALLKVLRLAIKADTRVEAPSSSQAASGQPDERAASSHISGLSAMVLVHLLMHGGPLLHYALPPALEEMERLRQEDAVNGELAACEGALAHLLHLLAATLSASAMFGHELPLEEWLFHRHPSGQQPPATLLAAYVAYNQPEVQDPDQEQSTISYQALSLLRALQLMVARPVQRTAVLLPMSAVVPRSSAAEHALQDLFRPEVAQASPAHFLLAVEVVEGALSGQPDLLESLLLPASSFAPADDKTDAGKAGGKQGEEAPKLLAGSTATDATTTSGALAIPGSTAAAKKKAPSAPTTWSALEGFQQIMKRSAELRDAQPELLCCVLRATCTLWQQQRSAFRAARWLRDQPEFWACMEDCITRGKPADAWEPTSDAWLQMAEAYAWHIHMLELFGATAPVHGTGPAGTTSATTAAAAIEAAGSKSRALLEKLVKGGALVKAMQVYGSLGVHPSSANQLQQLLHALYIELCAAMGRYSPSRLQPGLDASAGHASRLPVPWSEDASVELKGIDELMGSGPCTTEDLEHLHSLLLDSATGEQGGGLGAAEDDAEPDGGPVSPSVRSHYIGTPGSTGSSVRARAGSSRPVQALLNELSARPLGRALLSRAAPAHSHLLLVGAGAGALDYGPSFQLDPQRLLAALGPLAQQLPSAELLAQAVTALSSSASLAAARLAALQATTTLVPVLARDPALHAQLHQAPASATAANAAAGGDSKALLPAAVAMATTCTSDLIAWQSDELIKVARAPWSNLGPVMARAEEAAVCAARLLLHAMNSATKPVASGSDSAGAGRTAPGRPGAGAAASAASQVNENMCGQLVTLLGSWLRSAEVSGVSSQAADYLASALLAALQAFAKPGPGGAVADHQVLDLLLLDLLPRLCSACKAGTLNPTVGTQVILAAVNHYLPPSDWLPVLKSHLGMADMLVQAAASLGKPEPEPVAAASQAPEAAAPSSASPSGSSSSIGMLELALAVARVPEGARWLYEAGVLEHVRHLAAQLLGGSGGGLAAFASISLNPGAGLRPGEAGIPITRPLFAGQEAASAGSGFGAAFPATVDTSGAYLQIRAGQSSSAPSKAGGSSAAETVGTLQWASHHQQYCVLLSFVGALLRTLGQHVDVEHAAIELLAVLEGRLLLACLPPAADSTQPLTLASLFELERALFLLAHLAKYTGTWHLLLPGSLPKFRAAVTAFLGFAAGAGSSKPVTLECPPQSAEERRQASQAVQIPKTQGWFRVCSLGAADPGAPAPAASSTGTTPAGTPRPSLGTGLGAAGAGAGAGGAATAPAVLLTTCSEYSARLAEAMYACIFNALVFLRATAPQIVEGEAAFLGPTWPKPRELVALQEQCCLVLHSLADMQRGVPDAHRRMRTCQCLLRVLQLLSDLLSDVGCPPSRAHFTAALREQLGAIERALESGKELPAILTPSGSMGGVGGGLGAAGSLGLGGSGSMGLATSGQLSMSLGTAAASGQVSMSTGTVLF